MFDITLRTVALAARRLQASKEDYATLSKHISQAFQDEYPHTSMVLEYGEVVSRDAVWAELRMFWFQHRPETKNYVLHQYAGPGQTKIIGPFTKEEASAYAAQCDDACLVLEMQDPNG